MLQIASNRRTSIFTGALIGLLATAPLVAIFYLGTQLLLLPKPYAELFDGLTRVLPGGLVTFGIDTMVGIFSKLPNVSTDVASKAAEQSLAVILFLVLGAIFGALTAFVLSRVPKSVPGAYVGAGIALIPFVLTMLLEHANTGNPNGLAVASTWVLLAYAVWGMVVGVVLERLVAFRAPVTMPITAPVMSATSAGSAAPANIGRRAFLIQFGGAAIVLSIVSWGAGRLLGQTNSTGGQPIASGPMPTPMPPGQAGSFVVASGTRLEVTPNDQFYRVDIDSDPPRVDQKTWTLTVGGSVDKPTTISYDDLRNKLPVTEQDATLECISNPVGGGLISSTHWTGVKLADVLKAAQVKSSATEIRFTCADGYTETLPIASAMDERTLLAYATNGEALAAEHGFPLRLYTPDRYGMKNPKWITMIEAINAVENGYWTDRGWDKQAIVKTTSVIDAIATDQTANGIVPVGGIAFGGARGISKVEVSVDNGPWQSATLKKPISPLTWSLWRFDWQAAKGFHTLVVRAADGQGAAQIQDEAPLHPSGASGYVSKTVNIV